MINIEKVDVYGWETVIRGMRNPMNSWGKSDSWHGCRYGDYGKTESCSCDEKCKCDCEFIVGQNDLKLMKTLSNAGNDHGKFLRMINVSLDITAPLYWWKEFDTYKVGTVANSCSTMHKIQAKEFNIYDFSHHRLDESSIQFLTLIINRLNEVRELYLSSKEKRFWWQMIQLLPSSYNQKRTVQLNYAVLKNIYHSRKSHKLDEWLTFCDWIESLPYSELITG